MVSRTGPLLRCLLLGCLLGLLGIVVLAWLERSRVAAPRERIAEMGGNTHSPPVPPLRFATRHHTFVEVLAGEDVRPCGLVPIIGQASAIALDSDGGRLIATLDDQHTIVAFDTQTLMPITTWCLDGRGLPCSDLVYCATRKALLASDPGTTALVSLPDQGGLVKAVHLPEVPERWPAVTDAAGLRIFRSVVPNGTLQEAVEAYEPKSATASRVVAQVGGRPGCDGDLLYLAHPRRHEVSLIAVRTGRVLARRSFSQGERPWHEFPANVLADPVAERVYLPMQDHSDAILALDGKTLKTVWSAEVGRRPTRIALDSVRRRLYVTHLFDYRLFVLEADTGNVVSVLEYDDLPLTVMPDPRTGRVFVQFAGMISVLEEATSATVSQSTRR